MWVPFYFLTQTSMKRFIQGVMAALLLCAMSVTALAQSGWSIQIFPDVPSGVWYEEDVRNMVEWDVIRGNDDGTFAPERNVNRAELSAMWNRYDAKVQEDLRVNFGKGGYPLMVSENLTLNYLQYANSILLEGFASANGDTSFNCSKENPVWQNLESSYFSFIDGYDDVWDTSGINKSRNQVLLLCPEGTF